jgi:predicted transcriptional regulator
MCRSRWERRRRLDWTIAAAATETSFPHGIQPMEKAAMEEAVKPGLVELTAEIVSAYVANNTVVAGELPGLIADIHAALARAAGRKTESVVDDMKPAVPWKKSVMPEYIICLEDGKKFKSLKRHLRTHYKLSPEEYREKWGLPHDYPMVAPNYAKARSDLAKKMGLGTKKER